MEGLLWAPRAAGPDTLPGLRVLHHGVPLASVPGEPRLSEKEAHRQVPSGSRALKKHGSKSHGETHSGECHTGHLEKHHEPRRPSG